MLQTVTLTGKSAKFAPFVRKIRPLETRASRSTPRETWCKGWAPSRPPRGLAAPILDSHGSHGTHAPPEARKHGLRRVLVRGCAHFGAQTRRLSNGCGARQSERVESSQRASPRSVASLCAHEGRLIACVKSERHEI